MRRIDQIEPFRVMQLLEHAKQLEAQGHSMIHMEIGEPDFTTPAPVLTEAHRLLDQIDQHYTASTGAPELQQALSAWYSEEYGVAVAPERILITPGTSGAFSLIYATLLDPGESVLLPDPGYPCQRNFIRLAGGEPVSIPVGPESAYHLGPAHIDAHWQAATRAALVINPSNPTGTLIPEQQLTELARRCHEQGGYLISDEIYHGLTYGIAPPTALSLDANCIVVNGFSKRWAMTGWRIGWVIVPDNLIDACRRVMQNIFIAAPTLSQFAAIQALQCTRETEVMRRAYDERRRYLLSALPDLGFRIAVEPQGAFYIYADVSGLTKDSRAFCWDILNQAGVAITPGEDFGSYRAAEHVRFSYATGLDSLQEGIKRIRQYLQQTQGAKHT